MHTTMVDDNFVFLHDGDYSGDVIVKKLKESKKSPEGVEVEKEIEIPFDVLRTFFLEAYRTRVINIIENADKNELEKMFFNLGGE